MPGKGSGQTSLPNDLTKEGRIGEWNSLDGFREGDKRKVEDGEKFQSKLEHMGKKIVRKPTTM